MLIWLLVWFAFLPCSNESQPTTPFSEIKFSVFNKLISSTFDPKISLATVLMAFLKLWSKTLNFSTWQKNLQLSRENSIISSAWMHVLCHQLKGHHPDNGFARLFKTNEFTLETWEDELSRKIDGFAECLGLTPYQNGLFHKKITSNFLEVYSARTYNLSSWHGMHQIWLPAGSSSLHVPSHECACLAHNIKALNMTRHLFFRSWYWCKTSVRHFSYIRSSLAIFELLMLFLNLLIWHNHQGKLCWSRSQVSPWSN